MIWPFVIGGLAALPLLREGLRQPLADASPGADLAQGRTAYHWYGPDEGPVIVCVHGLTTPQFVWQGLVPHLTQMGYRVLTYDLFGRGESDRPRGPQDGAFFCQQLDDLLVDQNVIRPVILVGYSMGGAIVTAYADRHPERVRQLVLIAPAGARAELGPVAKFATRVPVLGDWLFHMGFPCNFRKGTEAERNLPTSVPNIVDLQQDELRKRGFLRSVLSSLRAFLNQTLDQQHKRLSETDIPILAIWGRKDDVIPLDCREVFTDWNPKMQHHVIAGAGHGLAYTHTDQVANAIKQVLKPQ